MNIARLFGRITAGFLAVLAAATLHAEVRLEVQAGGHDRENCPVVIDVPTSMRQATAIRLLRESDGKPIPVQRFGPKESPKLTWMIHDRLPSGQKQNYLLSAIVKETTNPNAATAAVQCKDDGRTLSVTVGGARVLGFNHAIQEAPEGIESIYRRSGYIHPVMTPKGNVVTGDFCKDHPHQHGLFNAWVNTTFRGEPTDFWNQAKGKGDVEFEKFAFRPVSGDVFASFVAHITHVAVRDGKRIPAINERLIVRVYNARPFLFELISMQTTATDDPIIVNKYHYGGLGLRGRSEWLAPKKSAETPERNDETDPPAVGDFLTSEGRSRADGNHTRARWVEMHGPIGSQHAGIVALSAPNNFRAPQTVRLHPTKPYFCFAPMVLGAFSLEPGDTYTTRCRYVVHDGAADPELAERMWQDLAHPPRVTIIDK